MIAYDSPVSEWIMSNSQATSLRTGSRLVLASGLLFLALSAVAQDVGSRIWQMQNGLSQNTVQALAQTPEGYLWIGTNGGLVRFDGFEFRAFGHTNTPALTEDSILQLYVTRDGALWIGTEGGGLVRYSDGLFQRYGEREGLSNGFVRAIFEDSRSRLWIGTDRGLFILHLGRFERVDDRNGVPSINVYSIAESPQDRILIGCTDAANTVGLLALDASRRGTWHLPLHVSGDRRAWLLHRSRDGSLWIGAGRNLWHWPAGYSGNLQAREGIVQPLGSGAVSNKYPDGPLTVTTLQEDSEGGLWLGTSNDGVFFVKARSINHFDAPNVLPDNNVLSLLLDTRGGLWVGTANGLGRLSKSAGSVIMAAHNTPVNVRTIYQDSDGTVWATTTSDQLMRMSRNVLVPAALPGIPRRLGVRTIFEDREHRKWVGTVGQGVFVLSAGRVHRYPELDLVRAFCEAPDGSMWVGMDSGLSQIGRSNHLNAGSGLLSDSVRALLFDRTGDLWVGTDGGVVRIHDGRIMPLGVFEALRGQKVYAIIQDREGVMWFGSRGSGLWSLHRSELRHYGSAQGLLSDNILGIVEGKEDRLWISSSEGIFSVRRRDLLQNEGGVSRIPIRVFGVSEGINASQMNASVQPSIWRAASGDIWFASGNGAVRLQPRDVTEPAPFPVVIDHLESEGKELQIHPRAILSRDQQNFEIHYAAINLSSPERVRFRYRLEGFDHAWIDPGDRRTAFYTNVPPGEYRFRVIAYDSDQPMLAATTEMAITRAPAWYQTRWFTLACVLFLIVIVLLLYRQRVQRIRKQFAAVLEERGRLARELHDTVIQGCVGVSTLLEAAASTQESSPEVSGQVLARARYQIHETVEEARRSVWNLRHQDLALCDLAVSMRELTEQMSHNPSVQLTCECDSKSVVVDERRHHEILHIAREASSNALQHAHASIVTLHLSATDRSLALSVADDGCGFVRDSGSNMHYGLIGMEERAHRIGGTLTITSTPGEGTCVSILVPLPGKLPAMPVKSNGAREE
ncbi:MAG: two-component regulator propeller domain-containing protein [Terracidiphilus sp.]